jgi:hypothetical protein
MLPCMLAELIPVVLGEARDGRLALLTSYLDASYSPDKSGYYSVAGFVGDAEAWESLERDWLAELSVWGLEDFHLTDVVHQLGHENGTLCIRAFSNIVRKSDLWGVGIACEMAHWRSKDTGYENPYHFCFSQTLMVLNSHLELEADRRPVALIVDDDIKPHNITSDIFRAYQENGYPFTSLTIGTRSIFVPLQAADLAVGALRHEWNSGVFSEAPKIIEHLKGALGAGGRFSVFSAGAEKLIDEALQARLTTREP